MQSANQLAQTAIDARSEVRESYSAYVTSYDVAKHYRDEVVPLRKTISDELLLRYNGMLASVFELLADSREQVGAVNSYIDALKDYWLAETDLQQAVGGVCRRPATSSKEPPQRRRFKAPQQHAARANRRQLRGAIGAGNGFGR
jgi:outer membrane protein TolC